MFHYYSTIIAVVNIDLDIKNVYLSQSYIYDKYFSNVRLHS